ncbi:MAG: serine/threonine protein kinase [Ralstonia sp.]|nr:serine/threonine protein kinase [Ralstonia sp.]
MPLMNGETFAGYKIIRMLGSGGMGEVYLAQHPRLPRRDALKLLPREWSADAEYRARFTREADLASTLWHPHIVGVHDRGEHDGQLWISMDFVDGLDGARLLGDRYPSGMPVEEVARIITAVAGALDYAHKKGLLHRDVKPANIMLTHREYDGEQRILLADFGIARNVDEISGLTATNMTVGTVAYCAPEQLLGEDLDATVDQYALAATAYHLLTGSQLYPHSNPAVVISRHLNCQPPALSETRPELAQLDPILAVALARNPIDRFQRCSDFARDLTEAIGSASGGASASAPTRPAHVPQRPRRGTINLLSRRWAIAAAVLAVILFASMLTLTARPWEGRESGSATATSSVFPSVSAYATTGRTPTTTLLSSTVVPTPTSARAEPGAALQTALPFCYSGTRIAAKPSSGGLLCKGHWFENLTWTDWGLDAADGTGVEAIKGCTPNCATGELARYPVEVHFSGPAASTDPSCPLGIRFYTQLIVAYPTSPPPPFLEYDGGPVAEKYNGLPSLRWNALRPYCF